MRADSFGASAPVLLRTRLWLLVVASCVLGGCAEGQAGGSKGQSGAVTCLRPAVWQALDWELSLGSFAAACGDGLPLPS